MLLLGSCNLKSNCFLKLGVVSFLLVLFLVCLGAFLGAFFPVSLVGQEVVLEGLLWASFDNSFGVSCTVISFIYIYILPFKKKKVFMWNSSFWRSNFHATQALLCVKNFFFFLNNGWRLLWASHGAWSWLSVLEFFIWLNYPVLVATKPKVNNHTKKKPFFFFLEFPR